MINICILHWHRELLPIIIFYLNKIKEENKKKIQVSILTQNWGKQKKEDYIELMEKNAEGYKFTIETFPKGMNYYEKNKWMIAQDFEYIIKHDEDVFLNNHIYDFLIENTEVLNDDENLFLAPILSNGIPTVEMFAEQQFTTEEKEHLYSIFLKEPMKERWGVDGTFLNEFTLHAKKWDGDNFYKAVDRIFHFYRGVHPVRFSFEAQKYINELILKKFDQFNKKQDYEIVKVKRPYYCNSCFMIKSNIYTELIRSDELRRDVFDEVPLNLYMSRHKLNMCFIKNSFGIHIRYRACGDPRINQVESNFGKIFAKKVLC